MHTTAFSKKILIFESIGFGLIIIFLWLEEILDIPHYIMGAPPTHVNLSECLLETIVIMILYGIIMYYTIKFMAKIRYLEGFLRVCSFCKRIEVDGEWITLEKFMSNYSDAILSHGICRECVEKHYHM